MTKDKSKFFHYHFYMTVDLEADLKALKHKFGHGTLVGFTRWILIDFVNKNRHLLNDK